MTGVSPKQIVFITGAFISNRCWDEWILYFESEGYACIAPALPYRDASPEDLRNRSENDPVVLNTVNSITEHFAGIVEGMVEKPILIGHSLGGLVAQVLLQRGLAAAAVAIHSFPPSGIHSLRFSFRRAVWEAMLLFNSAGKTYLMPFSTWRYAIAKGMDYDRQKELYYRYAIPESKKVIREAFTCVAKIGFKKPHAPLLFTSGSNDELIPASLNYRNYKKYTADNSVTDYVECKGNGHIVFSVPEWKKEADCILQWLRESHEYRSRIFYS